MKTFLIMILLLLPLVYAQEDVLSARKASLDLNANQFNSQMNLVINFTKDKSIDSKNLTGIKADFEAKLSEALAAKTIDELKSKEKEMKELAKEFKEIIKNKLKDYIEGLKEKIKESKKELKERLNDKINSLNQERRNILSSAYDKKINEINIKIEEDKKAGKESRIQNILFEKFEKAKSNLNETDFTKKEMSISSGSILSKTKSAIKGVFGFLKNKIKGEIG